MTDSDRAALLRFIAAVEGGTRPAAADARIAAAIVREAIGEPRRQLKVRGRGRPKRDDKHKSYSEFLNSKESAAMLALARRVKNREPSGRDFDAVGKLQEPPIPKSTMARYWKGRAGITARKIAALERELLSFT
jgi:hypothetical protein